MLPTAAQAAFCVMQYAVLSKLSQPQGRVVCDVSAPAPVGAGGEFLGPVVGQITLANAGSVLYARGGLRAVAMCECSRCLDKHRVELAIEVDEECRLAQIDKPASESDGGRELIPLLDGDVVDLTELVRQVLVLNYPPRSLCRPDCAGLCVQCGRNLNHGACECEAASGDARWAGLRALAAGGRAEDAGDA